MQEALCSPLIELETERTVAVGMLGEEAVCYTAVLCDAVVHPRGRDAAFPEARYGVGCNDWRLNEILELGIAKRVDDLRAVEHVGDDRPSRAIGLQVLAFWLVRDVIPHVLRAHGRC